MDSIHYESNYIIGYLVDLLLVSRVSSRLTPLNGRNSAIFCAKYLKLSLKCCLSLLELLKECDKNALIKLKSNTPQTERGLTIIINNDVLLSFMRSHAVRYEF